MDISNILLFMPNVSWYGVRKGDKGSAIMPIWVVMVECRSPGIHNLAFDKDASITWIGILFRVYMSID